MKIHTIKRWDRKVSYPRMWAVISLLLTWGASFFAHSWLTCILLDAAIFIVTAYVIHYFFGIVWSSLAIVAGVGMSVQSYVSHMRLEDKVDLPKLLFLLSYITIGIVGVVLIEWVRRMQYKSELIELVSKSRYDMFLRLDNVYQTGLKLQTGLQELLQYIAMHKQAIVMIKSCNRQPHARSQMPVSLLSMTDPAAASGRMLVVHDDDLDQFAQEKDNVTSHVRVSEQGKPYSIQACICKKFSTYLGDFFVWHLVH